MDRAYVIRHKWHHEGLSIRQIARELAVSRNTVRKYVADDDEPQRQEAGPRRQPVLDAVRGRIDELLQEWGPQTTRKQQATRNRDAGARAVAAGRLPGRQHDGARLSG